jgi:hypothetical protein
MSLTGDSLEISSVSGQTCSRSEIPFESTHRLYEVLELILERRQAECRAQGLTRQ